MEKLALLGGAPTVTNPPEGLFKWPIMGQEDYDAAMDVIYNNKFSGTDITEKFRRSSPPGRAGSTPSPTATAPCP